MLNKAVFSSILGVHGITAKERQHATLTAHRSIFGHIPVPPIRIMHPSCNDASHPNVVETARLSDRAKVDHIALVIAEHAAKVATVDANVRSVQNGNEELQSSTGVTRGQWDMNKGVMV